MPDRRAIVAYVQPTAGSERRGCACLGVHRSALRYRSRRPDDQPLRQQLRTLATQHPRWGFPMLLWALRAAGVTLQFTRPGKPVANAFIESFNGRLRMSATTSTGFSRSPTRGK